MAPPLPVLNLALFVITDSIEISGDSIPFRDIVIEELGVGDARVGFHGLWAQQSRHPGIFGRLFMVGTIV
jgi:hypothetical protein